MRTLGVALSRVVAVKVFRPLPSLLGNPHFQTLAASLISLAREPESTCVPVDLGDGDRLALEITTPEGWTKDNGTVVLLHGLSGDHRSAYMRRLANKLTRWKIRAVRFNMRDAGSGEGWARRPYHGGLSSDLKIALEQLLPSSGPMSVWGFSLGGNVALKLAGELGEDGPRLLRQVIAVCPATDLVRCVERIMLPENRIYEWGFVRECRAMALRRFERYPDLERFEIPENMRMVDFDNLYIVPIWGFEDAYDYYRKASARPFLPEIRVPTRILMSNDDPIVCPGVMTKEELPKDVKLKRTATGGHLGFLTKTKDHGVQWMDRQLMAWHANLAG